MLPEQIKNYRELVTLKDGADILLRPMIPEDEAAMIEVFSQVSDEDIRYLRDDLRDPSVIQHWCRTLEYTKVLPMLALMRDHIVGQATLHFRKGNRRHIAEVRIYLSAEVRERGLGTKMIKTMIDLARKHGVLILVAEIVVDQNQVIKAFQNLGFRPACTYEDFFMSQDGELHDSVVLTLNLRPKTYEF